MVTKKPTRRETMLTTASTHLDWAEKALENGVPADATATTVDRRIALATSWILLARETVD